MSNMSFSVARSRALCVAGFLGCGLATNAVADEDYRKLKDREPAFQGPIVTGAAAQALVGGEGTRGMFDASGVSLLSWIPLNNFPGGAGQNTAADCWGYVSPSGREYAIIGLEDGISFVEITNPTAPVQIHYTAGPSSLWKDVAVVGDWAYAVSEAGQGIKVFDMSQIDSGTVTFRGNVMQGGHSSTHTILQNEESGFLYLCGANIANGGLVAVSTANPQVPSIVGSWNGRYVHEALIVNYTTGPAAGREIAFCFTGGAWSGGYGVDIIDVTDKSNMTRISGATYPGAQYIHQGWLTEDRQYLYVNDELDEGNTVSVTTSLIFNVADPYNPSFVTSFTNGNTAIDHNLYVKGTTLYESNYRSGLRVWDAANPLAPVEVAWFDTYPNSDAPNYSGNWGNYPFFPSGNIILSDLQRGLFVVRVNCRPDFNGDGTVNIQDFLAYLGAYSTGDPEADWNGDGVVNIGDFLGFLDSFSEGCEA